MKKCFFLISFFFFSESKPLNVLYIILGSLGLLFLASLLCKLFENSICSFLKALFKKNKNDDK